MPSITSVVPGSVWRSLVAEDGANTAPLGSTSVPDMMIERLLPGPDFTFQSSGYEPSSTRMNEREVDTRWSAVATVAHGRVFAQARLSAPVGLT